MTSTTVAAVDLGATSGRVMLGRVSDDGIRLEESARFDTGAVRRVGGWHWDFAQIFRHLRSGLRTAARTERLDAVGVDAWAVDYGLVRNAALLGEPFHYRDDRTERAIEWVHDRVAPAELFERNGLQFLPFNTLYQLAAERLGSRFSARIDRAERILLIPDLVAALLTGVEASERTNASTTGLLNATTRNWDDDLLHRLDLKRELFAPLVDPGTEIAPLADAGGAPLFTVGSHDTASAVVGVPATDLDFAYVSCGTWGLAGLELDAPVLTEAAREARFTNELGVDGRVRFLHNVMGLWILNECLRCWRAQDGTADLGMLLEQASNVDAGVPLFNVDDPSFLPPGDMPARIDEWFTSRGRRAPAGRAEVVRSIIESLAQAFADTIETAAAVTGRAVSVIHVVGGGSRNDLLCRSLADRSGRRVLAGPSEATALGNVLVQARAIGAVTGSLDALRAFAARSFAPRTFEPRLKSTR